MRRLVKNPVRREDIEIVDREDKSLSFKGLRKREVQQKYTARITLCVPYDIYLIWRGELTLKQRRAIRDFLCELVKNPKHSKTSNTISTNKLIEITLNQPIVIQFNNLNSNRLMERLREESKKQAKISNSIREAIEELTNATKILKLLKSDIQGEKYKKIFLEQVNKIRSATNKLYSLIGDTHAR